MAGAKKDRTSGGATWAEQLRQAIRDSGQSRYAICQATGTADLPAVQESVLARFMAGAGITLATAERLGRVVGLELAKKSKDN